MDLIQKFIPKDQNTQAIVGAGVGLATIAAIVAWNYGMVVLEYDRLRAAFRRNPEPVQKPTVENLGNKDATYNEEEINTEIKSGKIFNIKEGTPVKNVGNTKTVHKKKRKGVKEENTDVFNMHL
ncbi:unnamed protein product [Diamesa serratosioi]